MGSASPDSALALSIGESFCPREDGTLPAGSRVKSVSEAALSQQQNQQQQVYVVSTTAEPSGNLTDGGACASIDLAPRDVYIGVYGNPAAKGSLAEQMAGGSGLQFDLSVSIRSHELQVGVSSGEGGGGAADGSDGGAAPVQEVAVVEGGYAIYL